MRSSSSAQIVMIVALSIGLGACTDGPTSPSASTTAPSTDAPPARPASVPTAADDQVQILNVHLQDYCSKGQIDRDQGADPWPITVTFSGLAPIVLPRMQHDFQVTLSYGPAHFESVTTAGYRDDGPTTGNITIPFGDGRLVIEQRRKCYAPPLPPEAPPPTVPPPTVPPSPIPPTPLPPIPIPPQPPICAPTSSAAAPHATMADPRLPLQGGVSIRGADEWTVEIHGRPDSAAGGYYAVKTSVVYVTTCTETTWLSVTYDWQTHPWHDFRVAAHNRTRSIDLVGQWVTK